jgi:hypothetical protein
LYKCAERTKDTNCHKYEDILHQIYISPNGVSGFKQENENIANVFAPRNVLFIYVDVGALGNPCSSFSSPSSLLCIRRGFDKNFTPGDAIHHLYFCHSVKYGIKSSNDRGLRFNPS